MSPRERMMTLRLLQKTAECQAYARNLGLEVVMTKLNAEDKSSEHNLTVRGT